MRLHIRRDDTVQVLSGKDSGKSGKVIQIFREKGRALVQGINFVKKHHRRKSQDQPGGILQQESAIHISNLMLVCPQCKKSSKTGIQVLKDGSRVRICKSCREVVG
ncbi:MAG: 50S ribosomal protein L24 [Candidatus Omnitrophica bacterium]|nr:50S ribosomal protein L24 [Candidatus Omnitrophota bacterium]